MLCPKCQSLLDKGIISQLDVDLMHELLRIEEEDVGNLKKVIYHNALKVDDVILVFITGLNMLSDSELRKIYSRLDKAGFKNVRFIEKTRDLKTLIQSIVSPARVLGVNIVWFPDGSSEYSVRIPSRDARKMPYSPKLVEDMIRRITGENIRIVFERYI